MKTPVVVLGLGGTGLSIVRQLARRGISVTGVAWAQGEPGAYSRFCSTVFAPDPSTNADEFCRVLLSLPVPPGTVLIPSADEAVLLMQTHAEQLAVQFSFYRLPKHTADALIDKKVQYQCAAAAGVVLPQTFYPATMDDVVRIQDQLQYPAFIKAHYGHLWRKHFSSKGMEVHSPVELREGFSRVFAAKLEALVQAVIPGPATGLISVCCHTSAAGQLLGLFSQRKVRQFPLDFGVGCFVESIRNPELEEAVVQFVRHIGYAGTAEVEFKRDSHDGEYKFIELNPRIWQQHALSVACGVDFAYLQYLELTGQSPPVMTQTKNGVAWVSLWDDMVASRSLMRQECLSMPEWMRSLARIRAHNAFALDDPGPAMHMYSGHVSSFLRTLRRRLFQ